MNDRWNPTLEEVIKGLEKVWDAFHHMEHEAYADYVFDALKLLNEQSNIIEKYHKADSFLASHGWRWTDD